MKLVQGSWVSVPDPEAVLAYVMRLQCNNLMLCGAELIGSRHLAQGASNAAAEVLTIGVRGLRLARIAPD